jgi:GT2 family glycosyltransferase
MRTVRGAASRLTNWARRKAFDVLFGNGSVHTAPIAMPVDVGPVYVIVRSQNRPLYLWASLDSLYRATQTPCRFIFLDNCSTDPMVRPIVAAFERRGMFPSIHFMEQNLASNQRAIVKQYRPQMGRYFVLIDADVVVEKSEPDWLLRMITILERDSRLGIVGSAIDQSDFIDREWARRVAPELSNNQIDNLIKTRSPERRLPQSSSECLTAIPPAGRLLMIRTELFDSVGLPTGNLALCEAALAAGYRTSIANTVRHRHLSLLNFFDYPDYDFVQLRRYLMDC